MQTSALTNQVAIKVNDLECCMAAGHICKLPDRLLLLLRDAHSPEVELLQGSAGCQARAQSGQALATQCIALYQIAAVTMQQGAIKDCIGIMFLSQTASNCRQQGRCFLLNRSNCYQQCETEDLQSQSLTLTFHKSKGLGQWAAHPNVVRTYFCRGGGGGWG